MIKNNLHNNLFDIEEIKRYKFINKTGFSDICQLEKEQLKSALTNLNDIYNHIETKAPAEGYEVIFYKRAHERPFQIYIDAIGKREPLSEIKMPKLSKCFFCNSVEKNEQMAKVAQKAEKLARIIETPNLTPLSISFNHKSHWFKLEVEEQIHMIESVKDTIKVFNPSSPCYLLRAHIGEAGGQTVPHTHLHYFPKPVNEKK